MNEEWIPLTKTSGSLPAFCQTSRAEGGKIVRHAFMDPGALEFLGLQVWGENLAPTK